MTGFSRRSPPVLHIKLKRQLADLFQHCRIQCDGWCCGWMAFVLTPHWIGRWCEFRDLNELSAIKMEIQDVQKQLNGESDERQILICRFPADGYQIIDRGIGKNPQCD